MPYALVVVDPSKAHAARRKQYVDAFLRAQLGATQAAADRFADQHEPSPPEHGALWTVAESTCPDGLPNCRHCGDPAYVDSCRAAGHCPHCGTRHGIAPDSVLAAKGLQLHALAEHPTAGQIWNVSALKFVKELSDGHQQDSER
jgi:hypothetical protein